MLNNEPKMYDLHFKDDININGDLIKRQIHVQCILILVLSAQKLLYMTMSLFPVGLDLNFGLSLYSQTHSLCMHI